MSENLKTSRYRNGGSIPYVVGNTEWGALTTGAWSNYDHDAANNAIYWKLYNWYTTQGDTLCPTGWHVPSDAEWTTLTTYLGGESVAGGKMKSVGTAYWNGPNTTATNESGFSGLPGGGRYNDGSFFNIKLSAFFWSATEYQDDYFGYVAWYRNLEYSSSNVYRNFSYKSTGASVRCLKDQISSLTTTSINQVTQTSAISGGNIIDNGGSTVTVRGVVWNTTGTPTISDDKTIDGSGTGVFVSNLTALSSTTTYYVRAYAINSTGLAYGNEQTFTTIANSQTVTDIDGNIYNTVTIGTQVWMSENLKTLRYKNGDSIPNVLGNIDWQDLSTGAWSVYNHDESNNTVYGNLYNWYAVADGRGICPDNWHVPTDDEWVTLNIYLGGSFLSGGGKMKVVGTTYWDNPNSGATNDSGFSALPGGYRNVDGNFDLLRLHSYFWCGPPPEATPTNGWFRLLDNASDNVGRSNASRRFGFSVRCLKN